MLSPTEILYFWSNIMQDHAKFFLVTLSYKEIELINNANYFKKEFKIIEEEVKVPCFQISNTYLSKVECLLNNFIDFKKHAISRLLQCNVELGLPPTFINHMINEAMEFGNDIKKIKNNDKLDIVRENILLHSIWLPDAAGHAAAIVAELDPTETFYISKAKDYEKEFNELFIKNHELGKMLHRTKLNNGTLEHLNDQVTEKIFSFICFLENLKHLRRSCKIMGTLMPLMVDHMIREEFYYLYRIRQLKGI